MSTSAPPTGIIWDVTYACPLRCVHCYSESGRRPSRLLDHERMLRVADALVSLRPLLITLAGGEPLTIKRIVEVGERISGAGIPVGVYTGGWSMTPTLADELLRVFDQVTVSIDGATADVHDAIRGRAGSFVRAMQALSMLDTAAWRRRESGLPAGVIGVDTVVVRSTFDQVTDFCERIPSGFTELRAISVGAVVPSGLASRPGFEDQLLTDDQLRQLTHPDLVERLRRSVGPSVTLHVTDNVELRMDPAALADRGDFRPLQIEPDGEVRAMPIYEGTVGNLLTEPAEELWLRAVARWHDPFVQEALSNVVTVRQWAEATRRIDYRFGSDDVRARIDRRSIASAVSHA
jgi:MoaA/NifB/PqqE/SkfB family radical SAM enzyme